MIIIGIFFLKHKDKILETLIIIRKRIENKKNHKHLRHMKMSIALGNIGVGF